MTLGFTTKIYNTCNFRIICFFYNIRFLNRLRFGFRLRFIRNFFRLFIFRFWREFLASLELEAQSAVGPNGGLSEKSAAGEFAYGRQPLAKRQKDAEALVRAYDRKTKHWDHVRSLYEEMVGFLKTRDADICLVGFPYSASMLQAAKGNDFFTRQTPEFWREFSRAHGIMYVNVIDFFDSDEYFLNETHVNRSGARVISGEILNICFGS